MDYPQEIPQIPHRKLVFKFDATEDNSETITRRKLPGSIKDEVWLIKSLRESNTQRNYEGKILTRIEEFVAKITELWQEKLQKVREVFEESISMIVQFRQTEIYYTTICLKEELQDVKDALDETETLDTEVMNKLKTEWFGILNRWKTDMFEIEEKSTKLLKTAVARYISKLVTTRHNACHTFDVMLALVLELNQIIMGNVQTITETEHDLGLLWDTHFKNWCVSYYLQAGLDAMESDEVEEIEPEEEEPEIEGLAALGSVLNIIESLSNDTSCGQVEFQKQPDLAVIPHLLYLENYWESFEEKVKIVLEVMTSEARKLISLKKFLSTIKTEERFLFEKWAKNAGYGEESEQHFIRAAEMAVYYIKELKTLMLKTVALWHDLTDRLDVLKYITEFLHYKQRMQIANGFQDWEIVMNFAVDELRQAHSLSLLENLWNVHIDKLFVEYKNLLIQSLQYEKSTLDTYTPMSKMTFELFVDALDIIITEQSTVSNLEQVPNTSVTSYKDLEECNFKLSDTIITCIRNTRIGYLECMVFLRNEIYKNMDGLDSLWVDKKKSDLDWQYSLKEEMMKHRMHRMKKDVLDVRATELKLHEDLLFRHAEVIREKLTLLSSLEVTDGIQPLISDFHVVAEEVSNLNTKVSPGGFPSIIAKMEEAKQKFIDLCLRCDHDNQRIFEHIDRYFEWMEQINIQLLRDIRLFSEGGNFSSDEVNSFLFVIQRLDKEMSNEKKNIDTKFTKGVVLMDMEIGNKLDKFIHYMKKTQSEILNKSNMALIVNRSKRAIKREIFNGRALLKKAEMSLSREQGWDITMLTELLEDIKNAFLFLNVPEDFQDITGLFRNRSSCSYNFNPSKSSISLGKSILKKRMASRSMVKETSRFLLFKLSVDEDEIPNTFLNKLDFILSKCKESLHTQIFNFTSQSLNRRSENNLWPTKSLNKAKAQKGTNIFLEIEPQLKEIQRQSLIAWLDMVNDALQLFNLFSNNVSVILNNEYEKFEEIWFSGMDSIENQFYDELKEFDKASQRNKAEMQRSLKTMYGHPNHKERLAALSNQAVEFCKSQTQDLKTIILYRRNQMKQLLMMFNEEKEPFIKDLNWKVSSIYENTELEQILYRMAHQLLSRPKAKKIIHILSTSRLQKNLSSKMRVLNYDMGSDSVDLNPNFKLKEDITSLIKNVILKLRLIISLRDDLADNMDCGSLEVLAQEEPRQYGLLCKSLKTSLIKTAIKVCKVGKLALAVYMEEMQSWLSNWRTDCTRLTDLFSYAQPLPSKEKMNIKMVHRRSRDSTQYPLFLGTANKSHLGAANKLRSHTTVSALTNITPATSSLPTRVTSSLI